MPLHHRKADLGRFPTILEHTHTHISLGDLHGNALKLIYTLIEEGILKLPPNDGSYAVLRDIYYKPTSALSYADLAIFAHIIQAAEINKERAITLIGDELADRGCNDYFTLLVLKKLSEEGADIDILLSNHSVEFIRDYEAKKFTGSYNLGPGMGRSLSNMQYLIAKRLVPEAAVRDMVEQFYKPMVKAINYTVSPEGEISIFTHAPVGLETIKALADKFQIPYLDNNPANLIITINAINQTIQTLFTQKKLAQMIDEEMFANEVDVNTHQPLPLNAPLVRLIWNRGLGTELITKPSGDFNVKFVHGHVGDSVLLRNGEPITTHQNLDNLFGKSDEVRKTGLFAPGLPIKHFTRQSSEATPKQLKCKSEHRALWAEIETKTNYQQKFNDLLAELKIKTEELIAKGTQGNPNYDIKYAPVKRAAEQLNQELKEAKTIFFTQDITAESYRVFKTSCIAAITNAETEFKKHRSWYQQLHPILKGVLGVLALLPAGIPALVISLQSKHGYQKTFFGNPETDAAEKLRLLKDKIEDEPTDVDDDTPLLT